MNDLMTTVEAAEALRTNTNTLAYWRVKGIGPNSARIGRRVVYRRSDVEQYIADQFAESV